MTEAYTAYCSSPSTAANCDRTYVHVGTDWGDGKPWDWKGPNYGGLGTTVGPHRHNNTTVFTYSVYNEAIFTRETTGNETVTKTVTGNITVPAPPQPLGCNSGGQCVPGGTEGSCATDADCEPPPPPTTGTIQVIANIPASWAVTGPSCGPCSGTGTTGSYGNKNPGSYTITPGTLANYAVTASPQTGSLTADDTLHFYLTYVPTTTGPKYRCAGLACIRDDTTGIFLDPVCLNTCNPPGATHKACVGNLCTVLSGPGHDSCQTSVTCGDGPGYCGDNVCDPGETNVTCPQDCLIPSCSIGASPNRIVVPPPKFSTLSWDCSNTANCSLDQGIWSVPPTGWQQVTPTSTIVYTVSCTGASATTTIRVFNSEGGIIKEVRP